MLKISPGITSISTADAIENPPTPPGDPAEFPAGPPPPPPAPPAPMTVIFETPIGTVKVPPFAMWTKFLKSVRFT
jgi:hypothetical protein